MDDLSKAVVAITNVPQRRSSSPGMSSSFRFSYSPKNALLWKSVFDKVIAERPAPHSISEEASGLRASTLNLNSNDALKWLAECSPNEEDRIKYTMLRQQISISKRPGEGIIIYFKRNMSVHLATATQNINKVMTWKDALQEWLQTAQSEEVWDSRTLEPTITVSQEDKLWIIKLLVGLDGVEMDLQDTYIKVMR